MKIVAAACLAILLHDVGAQNCASKKGKKCRKNSRCTWLKESKTCINGGLSGQACSALYRSGCNERNDCVWGLDRKCHDGSGPHGKCAYWNDGNFSKNRCNRLSDCKVIGKRCCTESNPFKDCGQDKFDCTKVQGRNQCKTYADAGLCKVEWTPKSGRKGQIGHHWNCISVDPCKDLDCDGKTCESGACTANIYRGNKLWTINKYASTYWHNFEDLENSTGQPTGFGMVGIAAGGQKYVWGIRWGEDYNHELWYCKKPCPDNKWDAKSGISVPYFDFGEDGSVTEDDAVKVTSIQANDQYVYFTGTQKGGFISRSFLFRHDATQKFSQAVGDVTDIGYTKEFSKIGLGPNHLFGIGVAEGYIRACRLPCDAGSKWIHLNRGSGADRITSVSADETHIYTTHENGDLWRAVIGDNFDWTEEYNNHGFTWKKAKNFQDGGHDSSIAQVDASHPDYIFAKHSNNDIYKCTKPCDTWEQALESGGSDTWWGTYISSKWDFSINV